MAEADGTPGRGVRERVLVCRLDSQNRGLFHERPSLTFLTLVGGIFTRTTRSSGGAKRVLFTDRRSGLAHPGGLGPGSCPASWWT